MSKTFILLILVSLVNENEYGHFSLCDALDHDFTQHCSDIEYSNWVREELAEWQRLLSKTQNQLEESYEKVQSFQEQVQTACADFPSLVIRGNLNPLALGEYDKCSSDVYTYENSCLSELIQNSQAQTLINPSNKTELCGHILKQVDNLLTQIKWLKQNYNNFQSWKNLVQQRKNTICCNVTCKHCSGPSEDDCTICTDTREHPVTQSGISDDDSCHCKSGFYEANPLQKECLQCENKCKTCIDTSNNCIECADGWIKINDKCACPSKHVAVQNANSQWECKPCHYSCLECTGTNSDQCQELNGDPYVSCPLNREYLLGSCDTKTGFYDKEPFQEGQPCHYTCLTCDTEGSQFCLTCDKEQGRELQILNFPFGECNCTANISIIESGQTIYKGWAKDNLLQCQKCNPSCITCSGPGYDQCTGNQCPHNKTYKQISDLYAECKPNESFYCKHCPSSEPAGAKEPGFPCHNTCKTCENGTENDCKTCHNDTFELVLTQDTLGKCICKLNHYYDQANKTCKPCHYSCGKCTGPNASQCLLCDNENRLFQANSEATDFTGLCTVDSLHFECFTKEPCNCQPVCQTCAEAGKCTSCKNPTQRELQVDGTCKCKDGSRDKYFQNQTQSGVFNQECSPCHITEQTCETKLTGPSALICKENRIKHNVDGLETCVCPTDHYSFNGSVACYSCSNECRQCSTENVCTQCISEARELYEGACPCKQVDGKKLFSNDQGVCEKCHNACKTCLGPKGSDCVIPTDPNTLPIGHNNVKDVHYIFIVESSKNMDQPYEKLTVDNLVNNDLYPQFDTKYELAQHAIEEFIIKKIKLERETDITDDISLINFSSTPIETYWEQLIKQDQIPKFPIDTTEDLSSNLTEALNLVSEKIQNKSAEQNIYQIIIIVDGDQGTFNADQFNVISNRIKEQTQSFKVIQFQSKHTETPDKIFEIFKPIIQGTSTINLRSPQYFVEEVPNSIVPPSTGKPVCSPGYYLDANAFEIEPIYCLPCPKNCKTCESLDLCTLCEDNSNREIKDGSCICNTGFVEYNNQVICKQICKLQEYRESTGDCTPCHEKCNHCTGPNENQCSNCNNGEYLDGNLCNSCQLECQTCTNGYSCILCKNGVQPQDFKRVIDTNGRCVCQADYRQSNDSTNLQCQKNCESNQFQKSDLECFDCHPICQTCISEGQNKCLTCYDSQFRQHDAIIGSCICIPGYIESQVTSDHRCSKCSENCEVCEETSDNCISCPENMKLINTGDKPHKCECEIGFYGTLESGEVVQCTICHQNCAECNGPQDNRCISCDNNQHREAATQNVNEFVCKCKDGFSDFEQNGKCEICHHSCKTCINENANGCVLCSENREKQIDGTCPPNLGFYECYENQIPKPAACPCNKECKICKNNANNDNCTVCHQELNYVRENNITETSKCINKPNYWCPISSYYEPLPECQPCDESCYLCSGSANHCTECDASQNRELNISRNTCDCSDRHFAENQGVCNACDSSCLTCNGTDSNSCLSCDNIVQQRIEHISSQGKQCICPEGTYEDIDNICKQCSYKCLKCTKTYCTQCSHSLRELDSCNPCTNCYEKELGKPDVGKCHHSCATCIGPLATDCTSCDSVYTNREAHVIKQNSTDLSGKCPCKEKFYDPQNKICNACHPTCLTCTGNDQAQCTSCDLTRFYQLVGTQGQCNTKCGFYYCPAQGVQNCDCQCICCTAVGPLSCSKCDEKTTLIDGVCVPNIGFYRNNCDILICPIECSTCKLQNGLSVCTSCSDSQKRLKDGKCVCEIGFFDNANQQCQACASICSTCANQDTCIQCKGANTEGQNCQCKEGFTLDSTGISCILKPTFYSIQVIKPGIIIGDGNNAEGSIKVSDPKVEDINICVKTVKYIKADHEGEVNASVNVNQNSQIGYQVLDNASSDVIQNSSIEYNSSAQVNQNSSIEDNASAQVIQQSSIDNASAQVIQIDNASAEVIQNSSGYLGVNNASAEVIKNSSGYLGVNNASAEVNQNSSSVVSF